MVLYSIVPGEIVFSNQEGSSDLKHEEIVYMGETVQVTSISNNKYIVNRVISTYPGAYLNPKLMPGSIIT